MLSNERFDRSRGCESQQVSLSNTMEQLPPSPPSYYGRSRASLRDCSGREDEDDNSKDHYSDVTWRRVRQHLYDGLPPPPPFAEADRHRRSFSPDNTTSSSQQQRQQEQQSRRQQQQRRNSTARSIDSTASSPRQGKNGMNAVANDSLQQKKRRRRPPRSPSSERGGAAAAAAADNGVDGDVSSDDPPPPLPPFRDHRGSDGQGKETSRRGSRKERARARRTNTTAAGETQQAKSINQREGVSGNAKRRKRRKRRRAAKRSSSRDTQVLDERNSASPVCGIGIVSIDEEGGPGQKQQRGPAGAKDVGYKKAETRSASFHDDSAGHFQGEPGSLIADRYQVIKQVGIGTFGRVLECIDLRMSNASSSVASSAAGGGGRGQRFQQQQPYSYQHHPRSRSSSVGSRDAHVAIKVVRDVKRYYDSALIEAGIIADVNRREGRGLTHCVVMHDAFAFGGHYCMVFESLGPSLYDFLKRHQYQPFPMVCVQDFAVQLLETLEFLHSFRLIHTDLKIENILLMNDREVKFASQIVPESTRIKVIDFGGACYDNDKKSSIINTRQYRAPEVMLGTGWSMPSDMWSVGCILAELYQGELLFATHDNVEHLALIEHMIGPFPRQMLKKARSTTPQLAGRAFDSNGRHRMEAVLPPDSASFVRKSRSLQSIVRSRSEAWFRDLLRRIMVIDPEERWTAHECLQFLARIRKDFVRNA